LWIGISVFVVFIAPYLVAYVFPEQAYDISMLGVWIAIGVAVLAAVVGIIPAARTIAGAILFICSWILGVCIWVWSVLIVTSTWGIVTLYIANLFLAVGAIAVAIFASLLGGHWSTLLQLVVFGVIVLAMRAVGAAWTHTRPEEDPDLF
jgi:hypothetical protein